MIGTLGSVFFKKQSGPNKNPLGKHLCLVYAKRTRWTGGEGTVDEQSKANITPGSVDAW